MRCPVDKNVMMVVEHRRIEIDYCPRCPGVWLDSGELELLIELLNAEGAQLSGSVLFTPDKTLRQTKYRCPICSRKMDKVWMGKEPRILIDSCPLGDGLWFDSGELQKVIHAMESPGQLSTPDILPFLGKAFQATHKHVR